MRFTINSEENIPIRGNLDVPRHARALVIIIHGFQGFKDWGFFPWLADCLRDEKFAICRFTMSGDTYFAQLSDLRAVVAHCQKRLPIPTFLLGHSRGGGIAILGASEVPNLRGVVTWSAIADANILVAASHLDVPLLVVHGDRDANVPAGESLEIASRARDASSLIIGGAGHTYNAIHPLVHVPRELELAAAVTARFLTAYA
jgi:pimeloyl-ACP methyl ester carboxylesterase